MQLPHALRTAREMLRHGLYRIGLARPTGPHNTGSLQERFAGIYERGDWKVGQEDVPGSGTGSTLDATAGLRQRLPALLAELAATSFTDVGCGDFHWMSKVELPCPYMGIDIVPVLIDRLNKDHGTATRQFIAMNAVEEALPPSDVVMCREVLFHLSFADAGALLGNIYASGARWVMLTSDSATRFNADIASGGARLLNLEIAPFRLGRPVHVIDEGSSYQGRRMGVWSRAQLADCIGGFSSY